MSRSLSWIEPDALAAALGRAGLGPGRAGGRGVASRPAPAPAARPAPPPRPAPAPPPPSAGPEFQAPGGRLESRLAAYLDWVAFESGGRTVFVLDQDGLYLAQREADGDLLAIAAAAMNLLVRLRSALEGFDGGAVAVEVGAGRTLQLVRVASPIGDLATGFVADETISPALLRSVGRGLTEALGLAPAHQSAGGEDAGGEEGER